MKNQNTIQKIAKAQKILRKAKLVLMVLAVMMTALTGTVFAADPLGTINSLSDFIFSAIKAIGLILLGFGVVQIGLSLKSHDASQRANGFLTFFGGVIIAFAKDILDMIIRTFVLSELCLESLDFMPFSSQKVQIIFGGILLYFYTSAIP